METIEDLVTEENNHQSTESKRNLPVSNRSDDPVEESKSNPSEAVSKAELEPASEKTLSTKE